MRLPNGSGWPWRRTKKENKTGEDGSYRIAHVGVVLSLKPFLKSRQICEPQETAPGHSKRLKRGDDNELERSLRLEKVVASKWLRLAVEREEEKRARLENDAATKWLRLAVEMEEKQD